jgi:hypothetical protein
MSPNNQLLSWLLLIAPGFLQAKLAPPGFTPCSGEASDPSIAGVCSWVESSCDATGLDNIAFGNFEKGGNQVRGIGAAQTLENDTGFICLSKSCCLHSELDYDFGPLDATVQRKCDEDHKSAIWLANEKRLGNRSFYAPYFATIPGEETYINFHPAYLEHKVSGIYEKWESWFQSLHDCYGDRSYPPFEEVKLAYVQVITRHFGYAGMTPVVDMFNTGPTSVINAVNYWSETEQFCFKTTRKIEVGEEIIISYGVDKQTANQAFNQYGFALELADHTSSGTENDNHVGYCAAMQPLVQSPPADAGIILRCHIEFAEKFCTGDSGAEPTARVHDEM